MGTVAITIVINIVGGNSLTPGRTAFKLHVLDVDTSINDINIDAITAVSIVEVLCEGAESKLGAVTDAGQTLNEAKSDAVSTM